MARGTPPTVYYRRSAGSAANFAQGLSGLPRGHKDQSGITRPNLFSSNVLHLLNEFKYNSRMTKVGHPYLGRYFGLSVLRVFWAFHFFAKLLTLKGL